MIMKWIVEDSLRNFPFWSGAKDTVEKMTDEQLGQMEQILEDTAPEDGYTDTAINDIFWHERDWVYQQVGDPDYPKVFNVIHPDGRTCDILVKSDTEERELQEAIHVSKIELVEDASEGDEDFVYEDFDSETFEETKFYEITNVFGDKKVVRTEDDLDSEDLLGSGDLNNCTILQLNKQCEEFVDWCDFDAEVFAWNPKGNLFNSYEIPVYAIYRICEKVLNPDGALDSYDIPDTFAINEYNRYLELTEEEIKDIDEFLDELHERMPNGFDIVWDKVSLGSPSFEYKPAFGLGVECVTLYVYQK